MGANCAAGQSLGLVENWSQLDWNKMAYLEALGYTPWWLTPTPPSTDLSGRSLQSFHDICHECRAH